MKFLSLLLIFTFGCSGKKQIDFISKTSDQFESKSKKFMITTQGVHSTKIAKEIIDNGGNIIDAAIAASFAIGVERPQSTGIGGGGFLIYHEAKTKKNYVFDFRERAPLKSTENMYLDQFGNVIDKLSLDGPLSIGVPGLVAGLAEVHRKFGKLTWKTIVLPAAHLAKNGFEIYPNLEKALSMRAEVLKKYSESREIFFKDGKYLKTGELLVQKNLAKSLEQIAEDPQSFYTGELAKKIVQSINKNGGILSLEDLKRYKVMPRLPIEVEFHGHKVVSMPPPSSGGTHIAQILQIMDLAQFRPIDFMTTKHIHYLSSGMQLAFADRATYMGDTDYVSVPIKKLISKNYAKKLFNFIPKNKALKSEQILKPMKQFLEGNDTTHLSLMDSEGNVVVTTQTINYLFGSAYVAEGTGIVMNDEMDDFSTKKGAINIFGAVGGDKNSVGPFKTPLSSMSPTIVFKQGTPVLALGTPNGTRILTCVAQTIINYILFERSLYESVAATRFHHQWYPDKLFIGLPGIDIKTKLELEEYGHQIEDKEYSCRIQAIAKKGDFLHGLSDPRGEGLALGVD